MSRAVDTNIPDSKAGLTVRTREPELESRLSQPTEVARAPVCDVQNVSKVYMKKGGEPVVALQQVSLAIHPGEVVAVIGPSGCGKSTLLKILAGLDKEYAGHVAWEPRAGSSDDLKRPASATVFQSDSLFPWLSVRDNVELPLKPLGLSREEREHRSQKNLTLSGLWDFRDSYPYELSGGMRQRAAMARALATNSLLLLLDEPFAALDAQTRLIMQQELLDLFAKSRPAVMYVTHDIEEAVTLGHRVVVLSARPGRIHHIEPIEIERHDDVMSTRSTAEFRVKAEDLWHMLAAQVGDSLTGQKR